MSQYAFVTDLLNFALPSVSVQAIASNVLQSQLDATSIWADGYLNPRYALPLVAWGSDLTMNVCWVAALTIMSFRGFNPDQGADEVIQLQHDKAVKWFEGVQRQAISPSSIVQAQVTPPNYSFPSVNTQPRRGW